MRNLKLLNAALACIAILTLTVFGEMRKVRFSNRIPERRDERLDAEVGDRVCLPNTGEWASQAPRVLLIVTSATCLACQEDASFDQRLYMEAEANHLPVSYVLPKNSDQDSSAM